jgi:hypothetical protein
VTLIGIPAARAGLVRYLLLVLWLSSSLAPLRGATLERLSLDEMIEKSTAIIRGRVAGVYTALHGNIMYTHYRVEVSERWKGSPQAALEVMVPGGVSGGLRQSYSGVPKLTDGKEYVLFLWTGRSGHTQIIGFTQGVFELPKKATGQATAYRAASAELMLDPDTGSAVRDEAVEMSLHALSERITAKLVKGAAK